jgi:hypothetical protein
MREGSRKKRGRKGREKGEKEVERKRGMKNRKRGLRESVCVNVERKEEREVERKR